MASSSEEALHNNNRYFRKQTTGIIVYLSKHAQAGKQGDRKHCIDFTVRLVARAYESSAVINQ